MNESTPQSRAWVPKSGSVIDGRYQVEDVVDSGGMGVVMRGEHLRMRRPVAVKLLHPEVSQQPAYRARFEREVQLAATIEHPNIVQCFDFGETDDGVLYLVMELLDGWTLKQELWKVGRMSSGRVSNIALQLFDGMAAAHLAGVVHRDLKPGNVQLLTDHRGRDLVKVLDFGLAKSLSSENVRITKTGAICGTAAYVAPEELVQDATTTAGDVYALGLILLELLMGRRVYPARGMSQAFLQQLFVPPRIPRRVWDTALGSLIARMLEKHPEDRPRDADELFQIFESIAPTIDDFRLEDDEIPPRPPEDLPPEMLNDLANGRYRQASTLRFLPRPEPFDPSAPAPDDLETQEIVMDRIRESSVEHDVGLQRSGAPRSDAESAVSPDHRLGLALLILAILIGVALGLLYAIIESL